MKHIWLIHSNEEKKFAERLQKEGRFLGFSVQYDAYGNWKTYDMYDTFFRQYQGIERIGMILQKDTFQQWKAFEQDHIYFKEILNNYRNRFFFICLHDIQIPNIFSDIPCIHFASSFDEGICDLMEYLQIPLIIECTQKNWRDYIGVKNSGWKNYQKMEQEILMAEIYEMCLLYHWYIEYTEKERIMIRLMTFYAKQNAFDSITICLDETSGGIYRISFLYKENIEDYNMEDFTFVLQDLDMVKQWLYEEIQKRLKEKGLGEFHHMHCDNLQIQENDERKHLILERFEAMRFRIFGHYQAIHERSRLLDDKVHGNQSFTQEKRRHRRLFHRIR